MPWLYADPDDRVCRLRGVDEDAGAGPDEGGEGGEGGGAAGQLARRFWDGSRDRWISVVSTRVDPDVVRLRPVRCPPVPPRGLGRHSLTLAHVLMEGRRLRRPDRGDGVRCVGDQPARGAAAARGAGPAGRGERGGGGQREVRAPHPTACCGRARAGPEGGAGGRGREAGLLAPRLRCAVTDCGGARQRMLRLCCACLPHRIVKEYLEWEQAMAGEKEDNPWGWVRKRLIGVRGYKPWFGHLFTKDQQEIRYRDIHADLRAVREHMEKEAQEHKKAARAGGTAAGGAGGSGDAKGKGRAEAKRPAYQDLDPMRRAHLFGVGIKAHLVSPWAQLEEQEAAAKAAAGAGGQAGQHLGEGSSADAQAASAAGGSDAAQQGRGGVAAGKKRKPATPKQAVAEGKSPKVPKGSRAPRDRAWIRFQQLFASTERSEVALRIKYEEACKAGTVDAMLDGKMEVPDGQGVAAARSGMLKVHVDAPQGPGGGEAAGEGGSGKPTPIHVTGRGSGATQPDSGGTVTLAEKLRARIAGNTPPANAGSHLGEAFPQAEESAAAPRGAAGTPKALGHGAGSSDAPAHGARRGAAAPGAGGAEHAGGSDGARENGDRGRRSQQGVGGGERTGVDKCAAFALSEHTDDKQMMALNNEREQETTS